MIDLTPEKVVAGGDALARDDDGRVVMIEGGIPGSKNQIVLVREAVKERLRKAGRS